jgi:hypothetical protein
MLRPTFPNALHQRLQANEAVSGQVEDLQQRVRTIEPRINDAEVRLGAIEPKVNDAESRLGLLESDRSRLIAYSLLHNITDQWEGILSAPLEDLNRKDRTELLPTVARLRKLFEDFVREHEISVPPKITDAYQVLSDEDNWKKRPLRDVFDALSDLRAQAGAFLAGVTLAEEPIAVEAASGGGTRSRSKRRT